MGGSWVDTKPTEHGGEPDCVFGFGGQADKEPLIKPNSILERISGVMKQARNPSRLEVPEIGNGIGPSTLNPQNGPTFTNHQCYESSGYELGANNRDRA